MRGFLLHSTNSCFLCVIKGCWKALLIAIFNHDRWIKWWLFILNYWVGLGSCTISTARDVGRYKNNNSWILLFICSKNIARELILNLMQCAIQFLCKHTTIHACLYMFFRLNHTAFSNHTTAHVQFVLLTSTEWLLRWWSLSLPVQVWLPQR